jgi:serine/threonine protein kinase
LTSVKHQHDQGIIHRDIKPENIMFKEQEVAQAQRQQKAKGKEVGTIKLIDFDTCQEWTPQSPKSKRIIGTLGYIAPEGYLGEYTPLSDLWSIGVILYILMTVRTPFPFMLPLFIFRVTCPLTMAFLVKTLPTTPCTVRRCRTSTRN